MSAKAAFIMSVFAVGLALGLFLFGWSRGPSATEAPGAELRERPETLQGAQKAPPIHHLLLEVRNLETSVAFYYGQFGFQVESRSGDFAMLKGDNVDIYLWEKRWDWEKRRDANEPQGLGMYPHFLVDNVTETIERLRSAGARIVQEPRVYPTFTEAFVADPDGYTWALISMPK